MIKGVVVVGVVLMVIGMGVQSKVVLLVLVVAWNKKQQQLQVAVIQMHPWKVLVLVQLLIFPMELLYQQRRNNNHHHNPQIKLPNVPIKLPNNPPPPHENVIKVAKKIAPPISPLLPTTILIQ
eukprot:14120233-Ditylum_brightwellii.AAC.1